MGNFSNRTRFSWVKLKLWITRNLRCERHACVSFRILVENCTTFCDRLKTQSTGSNKIYTHLTNSNNIFVCVCVCLYIVCDAMHSLTMLPNKDWHDKSYFWQATEPNNNLNIWFMVAASAIQFYGFVRRLASCQSGLGLVFYMLWLVSALCSVTDMYKMCDRHNISSAFCISQQNA